MILITMEPRTALPDPFCRLPAGEVKPLMFEQNQIVFHQGEAPDALFYVLAGSVVLVRHTQAGQAVVLHRASGGEMIAESSLFSKFYHCDCVAQGPTKMMAIRKASVLDLLVGDADFSAALVQRLAGQVQGYRRRLELQSIRSAPERVLAGLADGWLTGSIMQFAGDMGLSHEATYRALASLVRQGKLAKTGRGKYQVLGNGGE